MHNGPVIDGGASGALAQSGARGRELAALLDPDSPVPGVTQGALRPEIAVVAVPDTTDGRNMTGDDFSLTAGWGHFGVRSAVMPGQGRIVERDYTPDERTAMGDVLPVLGETTFDVYLNDRAYWCNIPAAVWTYKLGGYQVLKKWLSYRERDVLGRRLRYGDIHHFVYTARRIAAILSLFHRMPVSKRLFQASRRKTMEQVMPTAKIKSAGYENLCVDCPLCGQELLLNRASDLCTFEPISGRDVSCEECNGQFWLNSDTVNDRYEALLFDCADLLKRKRYMNCVLNVCQAYEMFFSLYLRVNLLYRPFAIQFRDIPYSIEKLHQLNKRLEEKTMSFGFAKLRNTCLQHIVGSISPMSLDDACKAIDSIGQQKMPTDENISSAHPGKVAEHLLAIKNTNVNEVRNRVVHKSAYRPTCEEAGMVLKEGRSILFPLGSILELHDDINWYLHGKCQ